MTIRSSADGIGDQDVDVRDVADVREGDAANLRCVSYTRLLDALP